ncbi:MAG: hypothetical protein ACXU89_22685 [Xanthobacteraceae bacterium]
MPTPQQVRDWMKQRQVEKKPPPTPEQVRQVLGWHLINGKAPECAR